jgi:hypothetical protein
LVAGKRYLIEFYIKSSSTLSDAGLRFSNDRPKQNGYLRISIDGQPHFEIDNNIVFNHATWTRVRGYYTPDDYYAWITIGTFDVEREHQSTFHIDDIKIVEWVDDCPTIQLLENWNFDGFTGITINAADQLHAGYNVGSPVMNGIVTVPADAVISFKATNQVGLFDGFSATLGSEFRAYNAPCGSDCLPPDAFAGISQTICDGQPIQLGDDPLSGYSYAWVADPQSATQYLSSVTEADPLFTPPSGTGDITYYVIVTNQCGQQATSEVVIHYDDTPSPVASFTISNAQLSDEPQFDVLFNNDVETITIEVLDATLTNTFYADNFYAGIDFQCCQLTWMLPVTLSPCQNYKIRVTVQNYCTGASSQQVMDWNRNQSFALTAPIPNVITPNNDGINDRLCVSFTGATQVSIEVKASSGVTVYYALIPAFPPGACIWNGECNQGLPACVNGPLEDGTYYYIINFYDCAQNVYDYTGFITLLNGGNRMMNPDTADTSAAVRHHLLLFPNPASQTVTLSAGEEFPAGTMVFVRNAVGQIVHQQILSAPAFNIEIDLRDQAAGIYSVSAQSADALHTQTLLLIPAVDAGGK